MLSLKRHLVEILLRLQDVLLHLVSILLQLLDQSGQIHPEVHRKVLVYKQNKATN